MRGIHSVVDDLRNRVFEEVARLSYEGGDLKRIDKVPYKIKKHIDNNNDMHYYNDNNNDY